MSKPIRPNILSAIDMNRQSSFPIKPTQAWKKPLGFCDVETQTTGMMLEPGWETETPPHKIQKLIPDFKYLSIHPREKKFVIKTKPVPSTSTGKSTEVENPPDEILLETLKLSSLKNVIVFPVQDSQASGTNRKILVPKKRNNKQCLPEQEENVTLSEQQPKSKSKGQHHMKSPVNNEFQNENLQKLGRKCHKKICQCKKKSKPIFMDDAAQAQTQSLVKFKQIELSRRRNENALANDLILDTLFQYILPSVLLTRLRKVNMQWSRHSRQWVSTHHKTIVFNKTSEIFRFSKFVKKAGMQLPTVFRSYFLKTKYTPRIDTYFTTFGNLVKLLQVASKGVKDSVDFNDLYNMLNQLPNLEYLEVAGIDFPTGLAFRTAVEKIGGCPLDKLKTFRINGWFMNIHANPMDRLNDYLLFLNPIFKRFTKLRTLDLDIFRTTIIPVFLRALKATPTVDSIVIRCASEGDILLLLEANLTIRFLTLNEIQLTHNGQVLQRFVETSKKSLEFLSLRLMGNSDIPAIPIPSMVALKELHLDRYFSTDIVPFQAITNAKEVLPVLQKVTLQQDFMKFLDTNLNCTTVEECTVWMTDVFSHINSILTVQDDYTMENNPMNPQVTLIRNIPTMFPCLKSLSVMDPRCSAVSTIFSSFPCLEELRITYSLARYSRGAVVDLSQTLTGLANLSWMDTALKTWMADYRVTEEERKASMKFFYSTGRPSLALLKNLKVLKLTGKLIFSEAVVYLAFLRIQPLEELILPLSSEVSLTQRSIEVLKHYHCSVSMQQVEAKPGY